MLNKLSYTRIYYYTTIVLIVIIYSMIEWKFPIMRDDWGFMTIWREHANTDNLIKDFFYYYSDVRNHQNGRTSHIFAPFTTIFSPWKEIFPILTGVAVAIIIAYVQKIACIKTKNNKFYFLVFSWMLILFLLPWYDLIFVKVFALNYIFSSAIYLLYIYWIIHFETNEWRTKSFLVLLLLAFCVSGWHEGFAIPTACGFWVYILLKKFHTSREFILITICFTIFAILFFITPPIFSRIMSSTDDGKSIGLIDFSFKNLISYISLIILLTFITFLISFKNGRKTIINTFKIPYNIIGVSIIISGFSIRILLNQPPRASFWPSILCIQLILSLIANMGIFNFISKKNKIISLFVFSLIGVGIAQGTYTFIWINKYNNENNCILSQFIDNKGGAVFEEIIQPKDLPYFTLKIPPQTIWQNEWNYFCIWLYTKYEFLAVLPPKLHDIDFKQAIILKGNLKARNINNYILAPYRIREDEDAHIILPRGVKLNLTYKSGITQSIVCLESPIIGLASSQDTLMYYHIKDIDVNKIESLDFIETIPYW